MPIVKRVMKMAKTAETPYNGEEMVIEFSCMKIENEAVNKMAEDLLAKFQSLINKSEK